MAVNGWMDLVVVPYDGEMALIIEAAVDILRGEWAQVGGRQKYPQTLMMDRRAIGAEINLKAALETSSR